MSLNHNSAMLLLAVAVCGCSRSSASESKAVVAAERLSVWRQQRDRHTTEAHSYSLEYQLEHGESSRILSLGKTLGQATRMTKDIADVKQRAHWDELLQQEAQRATEGMVAAEHFDNAKRMLRDVRDSQLKQEAP